MGGTLPARAHVDRGERENPRADKAISILPRQAFERVILVNPPVEETIDDCKTIAAQTSTGA